MDTERPPENPTAEKLRQELNARGRYYFKDLGMVISVGLLSNLEVYSYEATGQRAAYIHNCMNVLIKCYRSIPFDQITDHPDYDIFLAVKNAIPRLQEEVVNIIVAGKKDINEAHKLIVYILEKGNEYRARLKAILDEIRKQPGFENYGFQATSVIDGRHWDSAI